MTWPDVPVEGPRSVWVPWGDQSNSDGLRETHRHCRCRGRAAAHCQQDGRVAFSLSPYIATTKDLFHPTVKMQQISEVLADAGEPTSSNQIKASVGGKAEYVRAAVYSLIAEGYVNVATGSGSSQLHTLIRPYTSPPL